MIILGIVLAIVGWLIGLAILLYLGVILLVVGLILAVAGGTGRPVGGRRHYF
jgi:Family of unknown function (DUF6131)